MLILILIYLQNRTRFPTAEQCAEARQEVSVLDDNSPDMVALVEHFNRHEKSLREAYLDEEQVDGGLDDFFRVQDTLNMHIINMSSSTHSVQGASLNDIYTIYGAGAPFERLYFKARAQLQEVTDRLTYQIADREFEKQDDWVDFSFIEAYSDSQDELCRVRNELRNAQDEIKSLTNYLNLNYHLQRANQDVVHDEFVSHRRPSSV